MIAQGMVVNGNRVLMVRQFVQRGDIVWNFPGGGIEDGETPEQACIREVKEETGYDVRIMKLLMHSNEKYTYLAEVIDGELFLDSKIECNQDILEIAWIDLDNPTRFDFVTSPLLDLYLKESL